ncbi:MAG: sialidase family protein [Woeseiaceae bacterium]|nr:sialidase family protein [Woeseiaceae bacterium]
MIVRQERSPIALLCLALLIAACSKGPDSAPEAYEITVLESPAGADSLSPNLAVGPGGTVVMSWLEATVDAYLLQYAVFDGQTWGEARTVTSGGDWFVNWADFPSVVPISDDLWAAHWLVRRDAGGYAYDIHAAFSEDAGNTWSEPFVPHTDNTDTEHGFVSMFPADGGVGMVWLDGRKFVNEYDENDVAASGMTLRSGIFNPDATVVEGVLVDELICDCCQTDVAVTSEGPVAVYRDRTTEEIRDIYFARNVDGSWQPGKPVANDGWEIPGCPVNGPVIQADGSLLSVAWFSASDNEPRVQVAWSQDAGRSMSAPVLVSDGGLLGHVGAAMLPGGDTVVSWLKSAAGNGELHLRRVSPSGEAGPDVVVAEATGVAAFSVPQLMRVGDGLLLAWTDASTEVSQVRTAMIPLQLLGEPGENGD